MAFSNPIIGGDGELIRNVIRSENFVASVSGWIIRRDGTAEFSDVIIRGTLEVGPATGNQVIIDTDPMFGNEAVIMFPTHAGSEAFPAAIKSNVAGVGNPDEHMILLLQGPRSGTAFGEYMALRLVSEEADGSASAYARLSSFEATGLSPVDILTVGRNQYEVNPHVIGGKQLIVATAVQDVLNTVTPQNDAELVFAAEANAVYMVEIVASFECAAAGVHARTTWQFPSGTTGTRYCQGPTDTLASYTNAQDTRSQYSGLPFFTSAVYVTNEVNTPHFITERGIVHVGATPGNIRFRFAQGIINAAFPIRRNFDSWMTVGRI